MSDDYYQDDSVESDEEITLFPDEEDFEDELAEFTFPDDETDNSIEV